MSEHLSDRALDAFVVGDLPEAERAPFERHLGSCEACADRLAAAARLDDGLAQVARATANVRSFPVRVRTLLAAAAIAAGLGFAAVRLAPQPASTPANAMELKVVCPDGPDQKACVRNAHHHGLVVLYPSWAGAPSYGERELASVETDGFDDAAPDADDGFDVP